MGGSSGIFIDADSDDLLDEEPTTTFLPNTRSRKMGPACAGSSKASTGIELLLEQISKATGLSSSKKSKRKQVKKTHK